MNRPTGYTAMAILLFLSSAGGLAQLVWGGSELPIELPRLLGVTNLATSTAALLAAIAIWRMRHWAAEAYLGWMVASLLNAAYLQYTVAPRILALLARQMGVPEEALPRFPMAIIVAALLFHGAFLGLGYWYLRTHRPRAPEESPAAPGRGRVEASAPEPVPTAR